VPDPRDINPDLPQAVSEAIFRAMAKDPERRFSTAGEFVEALSVANEMSKREMEIADGVAFVPMGI
jgi:hypothetical protein